MASSLLLAVLTCSSKLVGRTARVWGHPKPHQQQFQPRTPNLRHEDQGACSSLLLAVAQTLDPLGLGVSRAKRSIGLWWGSGVSLVEELDMAGRPLNPGITLTEGVTVADSVQ